MGLSIAFMGSLVCYDWSTQRTTPHKVPEPNDEHGAFHAMAAGAVISPGKLPVILDRWDMTASLDFRTADIVVYGNISNAALRYLYAERAVAYPEDLVIHGRSGSIRPPRVTLPFDEVGVPSFVTPAGIRSLPGDPGSPPVQYGHAMEFWVGFTDRSVFKIPGTTSGNIFVSGRMKKLLNKKAKPIAPPSPKRGIQLDLD